MTNPNQSHSSKFSSPNVSQEFQISHSIAQVEWIQEKNRLTRLISQQPIKWLNPTESPEFCSLYLSGYGGGIVQGDQIQIDLFLKEKTKVALTTQSYTKAFKSPLKKSQQILRIAMEANSTLVYLPDPLIPQGQSDLSSKLEIQLKENCRVMAVEWFNAGRLTMGEDFSFKTLNSEFKILKNAIPLVWDRFEFTPQQISPTLPSMFGKGKVVFNGILCAKEEPAEIEDIRKNLIDQLNLKSIGEGAYQVQTLTGNIESLEEGILMIRFIAESTNELLPLMQALKDAASHPNWLKGVPFERKF